MNVFISWSGPRSKAVAEALRDWLPDVMQAVKPWISSEDIRKGTRWSVELARELESTQIGVICLTPENLMAPWLLFEAGALSKLHTEKNAHVCTYLIEVPHTAVTGPLAEFQHTLATKDDTHQLVRTINAAIAEGQGRLTDAQLDRAFERCWPELKQCLETLPEPQEALPPPRKAEDMLQEVLEIVRDLAKPRRLPIQQRLDQFARFLARVRAVKDLSQRVSVQEFVDLVQEMQHVKQEIESSYQEIDQEATKAQQEFAQIMDQLGQEADRLDSLVLLAKAKKARRTPAAESEAPRSSGPPTPPRRNRPVANVRQPRQRKRPS